jgi:hypothetical protein
MILSDSVPVWVVAGTIAVSGWAYELVSGNSNAEALLHAEHQTSIRVLEEKTDGIEIDIRDIKGSLIRIEEYIREN